MGLVSAIYNTIAYVLPLYVIVCNSKYSSSSKQDVWYILPYIFLYYCFWNQPFFSDFEVTKTLSSLINPSTVQLSCVAESYPDIPLISWQGPDGLDINSTSIVLEYSEFDITVSATLEVERINCTTEQYVCVFQSSNISLSSSLVCPPGMQIVFNSCTCAYVSCCVST